MDRDIAIKIDHLTKTFKLPHERQSTLKGALINFKKRGYEKQQVLTDLSFNVYTGEFLGILGRNGSGKSTLLKTISGIYYPDNGGIEINGKLTPFIELGVGFNPELSGRDNVFLNGALLGFSRSEIDAMYDEIVAFAELERFMDQKLKNYSSGMQVRLAFSIAIQANTDILVLDEVLAVGDEAFQRKCYDYFNQLKANGKTVILVTHDMSAVQRFCTRAIVLDGGKVIFDGDTSAASDVYRNLNSKSSEAGVEKKNIQKLKQKKDVASCTLQAVYTTNTKAERTLLFKPHEDMVVVVEVSVGDKVKDLQALIKFNNPGGTILSAVDVNIDQEVAYKNNETVSIKWTLPGIYNDGKYLLSVVLRHTKTQEIHARYDDMYEFDIRGWSMPNVLVHPSDTLVVKVKSDK
jgi:ABC-2 type transport system ATP-binding protein